MNRLTVIRFLCGLLTAILLIPFFAACKNEDPTTTPPSSSTTENVETTVENLPDEETSLLTTADFLLLNGKLTCAVESLSPSFDFAPRISVAKKSLWSLFEDAEGTREIREKVVSLQEGLNTYFIKVSTNSKEKSMVYPVEIHYFKRCTVTFYANSAERIPAQKLDVGSTAVPPVDPVREGYRFLGWYLDGKKFDFSTPISEDIALISHWEKKSTKWTYNDSGVHFSGTVAQMAIVWKDYDDASGRRPASVVCMLTETTADGIEKSYPVEVKRDTVAWQGEAPSVGVLSQGAGEWTVRISDLPSDRSYTFYQVPLEEHYNTQQAGTTACNTVTGYVPAVDQTAALTTRNARLYDAAGNLVVLQGVVTWNVRINGFSEMVSVAALSRFRAIGTNCLRITVQLVGKNGAGYVYVSNGSGRTGDYGPNDTRTSENDRKKIYDALDIAIRNASKLGMYVIVDWGILTSDPNQYLTEATEFFTTLATKYRDNPYVLYEICNEPVATWGTGKGEAVSVKAYGEKIIKAIRDAGSSAVVVLAPNNSATHISNYAGDDPIHDPLADDSAWNVAYTFHCYPANYTYENAAYTYGWRLRDAHDGGLTVIVTEFSPMDGTFQAADNLAFDMRETAKYLRLLREWDIGFCYFRGASSQNATSEYNENLMFLPRIDLSSTDWTEADLTECGKWYYRIVTGDGVLTQPDYTTQPNKSIRSGFDGIFADYGLEKVFPGFAIGGEKMGDEWCLITGDENTLSDALYSGYCKAIWQAIRKVATGGRVNHADGETVFAETDLPQTTADAFSVSYTYKDKTVRLSLSFGANPSGNGYGILARASFAS